MKNLLDEIWYESTELMEDEELSGSVDDRKPITYFAPWRYICQIRVKGRFSGTGTLIGPRTILTAAHVVWQLDWTKNPVEGIKPLSAGDITIFQGRCGFDWLQKTPLQVEKIVLPSELQKLANASTRWRLLSNREHSFLDYAILHLKDPASKFDNKVMYWTFKHHVWNRDDRPGHSIWSKPGPFSSGIPVNVAGYPGDKGYKSYPATKGDFPFWDLDKTIRFIKDAKGTPRLMDYLGDVTPGMSGSPVFMKRDQSMGGRVLVGIQSTMLQPKHSTAVFINSEVQNFIKRNTK